MPDERSEKIENKPEDNAPLVMLSCVLLSRTRETTKQPAAQPSADQSESAAPAPPSNESPAKEGRTDDRFDDDVEAYITSLRKAISDPAHIESLTPYLFASDIEVLERLARADDAAVRYLICKAKDDVLILAASVFDAAGGAALPAGPTYRHGTQGQMGRGPSYFHFAFALSKHMADPQEATAIVEKNLPPGLWKYSTILAYVTDQEFDFAARFAESEIYHLMRTLDKTGRRMRLERMQNEFLDVYLEWRQSRSEEARKRVLEAADELRKIDPSFTFAFEP